MRLHPKAARSDTHLPYTMLFPAARVVAGLARARAAGAELVFVLGEPAYYRRFGFRPAAAFGIDWEHPAPQEAFMAVAPGPGGDRVGPGEIRRANVRTPVNNAQLVCRILIETKKDTPQPTTY